MTTQSVSERQRGKQRLTLSDQKRLLVLSQSQRYFDLVTQCDADPPMNAESRYTALRWFQATYRELFVYFIQSAALPNARATLLEVQLTFLVVMEILEKDQ